MIKSNEYKGKAIIFSAPSGAGKTTIVNTLLQSLSSLEFSVSACTRVKRSNETHTKDYYFISVNAFKQKIEKKEFIEWEEVYKDNFYGTLRTEIERIWGNKKHVIFDVDVEGGINLKNYFQDNALSIFICPPSIKHLRERLLKRKTENKNALEKRLTKATKEMEFQSQFDEIILNDKLEDACKEAKILIENFLIS